MRAKPVKIKELLTVNTQERGVEHTKRDPSPTVRMSFSHYIGNEKRSKPKNLINSQKKMQAPQP
jgi:hypothetical protein